MLPKAKQKRRWAKVEKDRETGIWQALLYEENAVCDLRLLARGLNWEGTLRGALEWVRLAPGWTPSSGGTW